MSPSFRDSLLEKLSEISASGLTKHERVIETPQGAAIEVPSGTRVLNFCANNYLGLANHPEVVAAAHAALDRWGYGLASVRFICGTQEIHKELEATLSEFLGTDDTILYSSCFDANGGVFETLLSAEDAVISDELNHASMIDGIRLCKARRLRYKTLRHGGPGGPAPRGRRRRRALQAGCLGRFGVFSIKGWDDRPSGPDLRDGGPVRCGRHGGRQPRCRFHGARRTRDPRALWRHRQGRHPDRNPREGVGRRLGGIRERAKGDHRSP